MKSFQEFVNSLTEGAEHSSEFHPVSQEAAHDIHADLRKQGYRHASTSYQQGKVGDERTAITHHVYKGWNKKMPDVHLYVRGHHVAPKNQ